MLLTLLSVSELHRQLLLKQAFLKRYGRSEIRKIATVDVAALRGQLDEIARQRRELDTAIQAMNWTTDLVE